MSILTIKIYPDEALKQRARELEKIGKEEKRLAYDMIETMRYANGVGLAAPQVGVGKRIIVIDAMENNNSPLILINPRLLKKEGKSSFCEGCLSVPDVTSDIDRPASVVVEALDLEGKTLKIDTGGLFARVIQHEIDHLDGILFIDRIGFFKRKRVMKRIGSKVCMEL